jgi:hypothetical protein
MVPIAMLEITELSFEQTETTVGIAPVDKSTIQQEKVS